jgi:hypothetical protein
MNNKLPLVLVCASGLLLSLPAFGFRVGLGISRRPPPQTNGSIRNYSSISINLENIPYGAFPEELTPKDRPATRPNLPLARDIKVEIEKPPPPPRYYQKRIPTPKKRLRSLSNPFLKQNATSKLTFARVVSRRRPPPPPPYYASHSSRVRLTLNTTRPGSLRRVRYNSGYSLTVSEYCKPQSSWRTYSTGYHWETFQIDSKNQAQWEIHGGWLDPTTCGIMETTKSVLRPKPIVFYKGKPILFAIRQSQTITFISAGSNFSNADSLGGKATVQSGRIPRLVLPVVQGGSSVGVLSTNLATLQSFLNQAKGFANAHNVNRSSTSGLSLLTRIDISQAVSEPKPTLLFTTHELMRN